MPLRKTKQDSFEAQAKAVKRGSLSDCGEDANWGSSPIAITLNGMACKATRHGAEVSILTSDIAKLAHLQSVPDTIAPALVVAGGHKIQPNRVVHMQVGYMDKQNPMSSLWLTMWHGWWLWVMILVPRLGLWWTNVVHPCIWVPIWGFSG